MNTVLLTPPVRKLGLFYSWKGSAAGGGLILKDPRSASQAPAESTWVTLGVDAEQGEGAVSHSAAFSEEAGSLWDTHTAGDGSCGFRQTWSSSHHGSALVSYGSEITPLSSPSVALRLEVGQVSLKGTWVTAHFVQCFPIQPPGVVLKTLHSHHHWMDFLSHSAQHLSPFGPSFKSSGMSFGERERRKYWNLHRRFQQTGLLGLLKHLLIR